MAKATSKEAPPPGEPVEEQVETIEEDAAPDESRPAPRRAPGQKEVIPFAWKLCGYSVEGHTLTLFKSVEREDCEGQLTRHTLEGYYDGLKIYTIDEPVPESAKAKKLRAAVAKQTKKSVQAKASTETASRKSSKAPNVVKTPMGTLVDGRITVRRKKGALDSDVLAPKGKSRRSAARKSAGAGDKPEAAKTGKSKPSKDSPRKTSSKGASSGTQAAAKSKRSGKTTKNRGKKGR